MREGRGGAEKRQKKVSGIIAMVLSYLLRDLLTFVDKKSTLPMQFFVLFRFETRRRISVDM